MQIAFQRNSIVYGYFLVYIEIENKYLMLFFWWYVTNFFFYKGIKTSDVNVAYGRYWET